MRGDPIVLVECDTCHGLVEIRLVRLDDHTWTTASIAPALSRRGWATDGEGHDYCCEACRMDAVRRRN